MRIKLNPLYAVYVRERFMADTLFLQSIIQFAPLRNFTRIHISQPLVISVRELFPKALIDEQNLTHNALFEIIWSFLAAPTFHDDNWLKWSLNGSYHRSGGLPSTIFPRLGEYVYHKYGKCHRIERDRTTNLTLPAFVRKFDSNFGWYKNGVFHRTDRDRATKLMLPASILEFCCKWYINGHLSRLDRDQETGAILPNIVYLT